VSATDVRSATKEQILSLGAKPIFVEGVAGIEGEGQGGYASETSPEYQKAQAELVSGHIAKQDIVITTALIPGRPAPRLITADMVAAMRPGSVLVDMAASNGGNVEGAVADEKVVTPNGVTIIGYTDLAGRLPAQASQLYGTNLVNLMKLMTPEKDGQLVLDFDDVVQRGVTVVRDGESTWPPPEISVSAAPAATAASGSAAAPPVKEEKKPVSPARRFGLVGVAAVALFLITAFSPPALINHLIVFALAIVIGYYVIGNVHHALHTPLMSVTNAISGIILVGALLQIGQHSLAITIVATVATLLATINVFGGFAVTRRMLGMFRRS